jgi:hypothetical protein
MSEAADHIYKRAKDRVYKLLPCPWLSNSIVTTGTNSTNNSINNNNNNMKTSIGNKKQSMKNRSSDTTSVGIGMSGGAETTAGDDDRVMMYTYIYRSSDYRVMV